MLRNFSKHFNETVFRGPDTEGAGGGVEPADVLDDVGTDDAGTDNDPDDNVSEPAEGEGTEKLSVREQLKKSIAEVNAAEKPPTKRAKSGRPADKQAATPAPEGGEPAPAPTTSAIAAPESLSKEAKAVWDNAPPEIQAAFIKREQDMARGVEELKQKYTLIDQAIAPHTDALRQMNATPQEAVNRMFLWFKALAGKPVDSFPALAQSMGVDWKQLVAATSGQATAPAPDGTSQTGAPEIPEPVRQYVGQLEQQVQRLMQHVQQVDGRFGSMEQSVQQQNMARTTENLNIWSKDKPYFNEVRQEMARLLETGMVPLMPDGQVDLDTAYERAIYFNPEVRGKVLAEQQQANQKVQQQTAEAATTATQAQVGRAKKASVSIPASGTPGAGQGVGVAKKKPGEKLSVRESLKAAMAELRDQ